MNIADVHSFIFFMLRKNKNGIISHEWIDDALHSAQLSRFSELLPPKSLPGQPIIPVQQMEYGNTINGMDYLFPFKKKKDFDQNDTVGGLLKLENDYAHLRTIYVLAYNNKYEKTKYTGVPILNENQLTERLDSQIINPRPGRPVAIMVFNESSAIQIYPQQPFTGRYYYFSKPVKPKYAYTMNGRVETQDIENSIDLIWDDESINAIIWKALQPLGISLNESMQVQWSQYKEQKEG